MQRPEAKNPPERPLLSAETVNFKTGGKIPAETTYSASYRNPAVCGDWMVVGAVRYEPVSTKQFPANREFYWEFCDSGPSEANFVARNHCAAATFTKFPTQNNRENILKNREFLSGNRESPARCVGTVVSVHFSHTCFFAVRTRSVLTEKFSGGERDVVSSRALRRGFLAGPPRGLASK